MAQYTTNFVSADGLDIFYRSSGPQNPSTSVVLLLHGFPSSSHQYRHLIPLLSTGSNNKYRIVAPDLPGFGFTKVPTSRNYVYTFENLSKSLEAFLDALKIEKFSMYVFDYGAPTGYRLALRRPGGIQAIITQNGNAYDDGLSAFWDTLRPYWKSGSSEDKDRVRAGVLTLEATEWQYTHGTNPSKIAPEAPFLDYALISRPGNDEVQLALFYDYQKNVELYPNFQGYFRSSKVPILAVWGKNDEIFLPEGAEAFKRDGGEKVEVKLLDAGHFAVESNAEEISKLMLEFLKRNGI
ncbi:uncharacterized protein BP5553_04540 [Venustampulla echinocandica]|uniref:AB hydrolase-1 domain-containing protein n=1 Tax=Venustampulla echinocandica TaxID=2656787 RepID=A0A370TNL8_9HELO|nr:uncharacterized protein BP5553_04540 [Venustampulla echinocandica]RDL37107.1 hypothetical protein BP5553_04540 [Venustampulla echinocandica]